MSDCIAAKPLIGHSPVYLKSRPVCVALLSVTSFLLFSHTIFFEFVYDDADQIIRNPWIRDLGSLADIFFSSLGSFIPGLKTGYYRPMVHIVYMSEYSLFGLEPWGYHLFNILFQCSVTVMVYLVSCRLIDGEKARSTSPLLVAFCFAIHPIHSEVVSWIATMQEMAFTTLLLVAFYLHMGNIITWGKGAFCGAFFFLALLFKETSLVFLGIALLYDITFREFAGARKRWRLYLLYLIAAGVYISLRTFALGDTFPAKRWFDLTGYQYLINVFPVIVLYFQKFFLPFNQNAHYFLEPLLSVLEPVGVLSTGFFCLIVISLFRLYGFDKLMFFSFSWACISILPTLYLPALGKSFFSDRYLYFPSIGLSLFVVLFARRLYENNRNSFLKYKKSLIFFMLCLSLFFVAGTVDRNMVWKDEYTLWTDTVKKSPGSGLPHYNLGIVLAEMGRNDEAVQEFNKTISADPTYENAYFNLGVMYQRAGRNRDAILKYGETLRLNPESADAHLNLGVIFRNTGQKKRAEKHLKRALQLDKSLDFARYHLDRLEQ